MENEGGEDKDRCWDEEIELNEGEMRVKDGLNKEGWKGGG